MNDARPQPGGVLSRMRAALGQAWWLLRHGARQLSAVQEQLAAQQRRAEALEHALAQLQQQQLEWQALREQVQAMAATAQGTAATLQSQITQVAEHAGNRAAQIEGRNTALESGLQALSQTLHQHLPAQATHLQALQSQFQTLQQQQQALQGQAEGLRQHLGLNRPQLPAEARERFYEALEAEFRGSPADVQRRQAVYRHWIDQAPPGPVIDLGCGRGEWLELLKAWGRPGLGLDASGLNAEQARARGLAVEQGDALAWLAAQPDQSAAAITAFHLAEHLPFDDLHLLMLHIQRVLQPSGVLLLETPNPENLAVATQTFWLDPTHRKPLPPPLLATLARVCGLQVVTLQRLNPPEEDPGPVESDALLQALVQGRDCALVARKPGPAQA